MATRSTIAVEHQDGTVTQVYCHWDGYLDHNGKLLQKHYNNAELAKKLVSLGSISLLNERIDPVGQHSFEKPEKGTTIFYARDRNEKLRVNSFQSIDELVRKGQQEEYNYLYSVATGTWYVSTDNEPFEPLEKALEENAQ
jgi:hypothetical protein